MTDAQVRASVVEQIHVTGERRWGVLVQVEGEKARWIDADDESEAHAILDDFERTFAGLS